MWRGGEKRVEVKKRGGRRVGEQGTGNHRYVQDGGWVAWREDGANVSLWRSEGTAGHGEGKTLTWAANTHICPPERYIG